MWTWKIPSVLSKSIIITSYDVSRQYGKCFRRNTRLNMFRVCLYHFK